MSGGPPWEPVEPAPQPSGPRPMRLGQVLEVGVRILRRHWPVMLAFALLFAGPGALLTSATGMRFTEVAADLLPGIEEGLIDTEATITQAELDRLLGALVPYLAATFLAGVLLSIGALAFSAVVADDYHGRTPTLGSALRRCLRRTPSAFGFMLITTLLTVALILAGVIGMSVATMVLPSASMSAGGPGVFLALVVAVAVVVALVYLSMRWAPAFPAMIEEEVGARAALRRSWHLSGDNIWRIFVISLMAALIATIVGSVLSQLLAMLLADALAPALGLDELLAESIALALGTLILAPLLPVLTAVLYFDLRTRRDLPGSDPSGVPADTR